MNRVSVRDWLDLPVKTLLHEVSQLERDGLFQRYDNPFEAKWFLADKTNLPPNIDYVFSLLRDSRTCWWVAKLLQVPISHADVRHYGGLFIYDNNDYLKAHVDAGRHPEPPHLVKVATAICYLTDAELEFYVGDTAEKPDPLVWSRSLHTFKAGDLVLFTNSNTAWHGVPIIRGGRRIALTVSYMAPSEFEHVQFRNLRTRAYFARTLWDKDTPETERIRQMRADEQLHSEVYRIGGRTNAT